jgi:hypothetical protein
MTFFIENTLKVRFGSLDCTKTPLGTYKPYLFQTLRQTFGKPTQTFTMAKQTFQTSEVCQKFGFTNYLSLLFIIIYRNSFKMSKLLQFVSKPALKPYLYGLNMVFSRISVRSKLPNLDFRVSTFLKTSPKLFRQNPLKVNPLSESLKHQLNNI